jgi:hypothetical protein
MLHPPDRDLLSDEQNRWVISLDYPRSEPQVQICEIAWRRLRSQG